ncbi:MAG: hypothetical protein MHMPM18_004751 [Marteilia pararefringens]
MFITAVQSNSGETSFRPFMQTSTNIATCIRLRHAATDNLTFLVYFAGRNTKLRVAEHCNAMNIKDIKKEATYEPTNCCGSWKLLDTAAMNIPCTKKDVTRLHKCLLPDFSIFFTIPTMFSYL